MALVGRREFLFRCGRTALGASCFSFPTAVKERGSWQRHINDLNNGESGYEMIQTHLLKDLIDQFV